MSAGPRFPLSAADRVCEEIRKRWGLSLEVVGSVRRRRASVGDIELIAPLPEGWDRKHIMPADDPLFQTINATMQKPWQLEGLFGEPVIEPESPMGRIERGLKPGFRAASFTLFAWGREFPCQVYRYTPANRGWMQIERTGPREFGIHFLVAWKKQYSIPREKQASINNHLVDVLGEIVQVKDEATAFQKAGMRQIPPEERDEYAERAKALWEARKK